MLKLLTFPPEFQSPIKFKVPYQMVTDKITHQSRIWFSVRGPDCYMLLRKAQGIEAWPDVKRLNFPSGVSSSQNPDFSGDFIISHSLHSSPKLL